jgi:hypothetical protein
LKTVLCGEIKIRKGFTRRRVIKCREPAKTTPPTAMNDSELDRLLKAANTPAMPPAGFQHDVWSRIEAEEMNDWKNRASRMMERFLGFFALPPVAVATCTAMVLAGVWFGMAAGKPGPAGEVAYVQSISPFAHAHR